MMNFKTIVISHYHWLPGGVRSVVEKSLTALNATGGLKGVNVHLVVGDMHKTKTGSGSGEGDNLHIDDFRSRFSGMTFGLEITEDARLNYAYDPWPDEKTFRSAVSDLAGFFLRRAGQETVFWPHNVNLCKNPLVTAAWVAAARLSESGSLPHRYLFHIHDFAECGRIENIVRTRTCWGTGGISRIYPDAANTGFAVLSTTDKNKLAAAGVNAGRIFHIPNVVSKPAATKNNFKTKGKVSQLISGYAADRGYRFNSDPNVKWWLLPVRLIRRKNVLEAVVLGAVSPEPVQLLLTLYANSRTEMPYADKVSDAVKQGRLPMVIGFGKTLIDSEKKITLDAVMKCVDAVTTTSLMEGFGYAFTDPVMNNKPLIGRNLENATLDLRASGFPAADLYDALLVPVHPNTVTRKDINRLITRGQNFAERYKRWLNISRKPYLKFMDTLEGLANSDSVDFGMLDLELQLKIVSRLKDTALINEIKGLNPGLPHTVIFEKGLADHLMDGFGPETNAANINDTFNKLPELSKLPVSQENISQNLLDAYFTPYDQRPLYSGW